MNKTRFSRGALFTALAAAILLWACGSNNAAPADDTAAATETETPAASGFAIEEVQVNSPLNAEWVAAGKSMYEMKCQSCHKLTDEKLVGPGWKDITKRRTPGWIVAMTTNPDEMLQKDPDAQKLLEECLVKMPNQNVSKDEALHLLEFMRQNDGAK
ncbi:c-type cytochrome [Pseudocnuella soli]|uniref:c-type cytochrome n=1 Tax=Pseudocnuella soli TaxID=2502779 RepID=UPI0010520FD3|nr:c-type cytochrome [Pseudocnuella soli]